MSKISDKNLIWLDLEMSGLDLEKDRIIEIATIITNSNLQVIAEGPVLAIHQPNELLNNMNEWCKGQHGKSGLTERVTQSQITEETAERETLAFIQHYVPEKQSPLCGNSICMDRRFLYLHMPKLEAYFHYRNLDVSTVKTLAQHWAPHIASQLNKVSTHTALQDIRDSIDELKFYREHLFVV